MYERKPIKRPLRNQDLRAAIEGAGLRTAPCPTGCAGNSSRRTGRGFSPPFSGWRTAWAPRLRSPPAGR